MEPPKPENLPKKPLPGLHLFGADQRKQGKVLGLKQLSEAWVKLGAEGQKPFMDQATEATRHIQSHFIFFQTHILTETFMINCGGHENLTPVPRLSKSPAIWYERS